MNSVDLVILIVIAFNGILGLIRGAAWQILRIGSVVLGVWVAARFGREFLGLFPESFGLSPEIGIHVARIVLFLSVYLIMYGVTNLAQALIKKVKLGGMDRSLGALLGMAKGALLCCLVLYLQLWPLVGEIPIVEDQLHGNVERAIPASKANRIFLEHIRSRVDAIVPQEQKEGIERLTEEIENLSGEDR